MEYSLYELLYFFAIYAVLGWCIEVVFHIVTYGEVVNRGFLNGPLCPIYGFGMIIIITCLQLIHGGAPVIFLGGFLLASVLEFVTGFLLEKIFHQRWWDYSSEKFNIHGYVCLKYSLLWGLGGILVMDVLHPLTEKLVNFIPYTLGIVILVFYYVLFTVDAVVTASAMRKLDRKLRAMQDVADGLRQLSDGMSEAIGKNVSRTEEARVQLELLKMDTQDAVKRKREEALDAITDAENAMKRKREETRDAISEMGNAVRELGPDLEDLKKRYEDLKAKYAELSEHRIFGGRRLLKAFPSANSKDRSEAFENLREKILQKHRK